MNNQSIYEDITQRIVDLLETGTVPWHKPWTAKAGFPRNYVTKKAYRGVNVLLLHAMAYESPFWLTYKQAAEHGGNVRKGEKACPVVFWKQLELEDKETGELEKIPMLRFYFVFNLSQCENIKDTANAPQVQTTTTEAAEIVQQMPQRPAIKHGMRKAFYSPGEDCIGLPDTKNFETEAAYYSVLFHEMIHSTGHTSRLNRPTLTTKAGFGASDYCREELIAELGASFLCGQASITTPSLIENSAAYLRGWLEALKNDKTLIVQAAAQAQRATDFILAKKFGEASA